MEILYYMIAMAAGLYFLQACASIARALNGIRTALETRCNLEPIRVRTNENPYKRKGVDL